MKKKMRKRHVDDLGLRIQGLGFRVWHYGQRQENSQHFRFLLVRILCLSSFFFVSLLPCPPLPCLVFVIFFFCVVLCLIAFHLSVNPNLNPTLALNPTRTDPYPSPLLVSSSCMQYWQPLCTPYLQQLRGMTTKRQHKAKQGKARQAKTRQDKTRQDKTRRDKIAQHKITQDKLAQDKTR